MRVVLLGDLVVVQTPKTAVSVVGPAFYDFFCNIFIHNKRVDYEKFRYLEMGIKIFSTILEYLEKPPPRLIKYYKKTIFTTKTTSFLKNYLFWLKIK